MKFRYPVFLLLTTTLWISLLVAPATGSFQSEPASTEFNVESDSGSLGSLEPSFLKQVALGANHSCALSFQGTVKCWGFNAYGQLGDGATVSTPAAVDVIDISNAIQIEAGLGHTCALLDSGEIYCWGLNASGQLGDGTKVSTQLPVRVLGISDAVQISAGSWHTCAILASKQVKCWGANGEGQLGDGTFISNESPSEVTGIENAVAIDAGYLTTCALIADGTIYCWGLLPASAESVAVPSKVPDVTNAIQVELGQWHACALIESGQVKCWGTGGSGQLGNGGNDQSLVPTLVADVSQVTEISSGQYNSCALLSTGRVMCWGTNAFGQFVNPLQSQDYLSPIEIPGVAAVAQLDLGANHACVIRVGDHLQCWGNNQYGQLGNLAKSTESRPEFVDLGMETDVEELVSGPSSYSSCALLTSAKVKCWGSILANGVQELQAIPVDVPGLSSVSQLAVGGGFACVLDDLQKVQCWGSNEMGQLGDGTTTDSSIPMYVDGLSGVTQIGLGHEHACALVQDGKVMCWGNNTSGQVGNGTITETTTPVEVDGIDNAVQVALGASHTCALLESGQVKCWGSAFLSSLGDGSTSDSSIPVTVIGVDNASSISVGGYHSCAIVLSGHVKCWGNNGQGQVGDATRNLATSAVEVFGIDNALQISLGGVHSCAVLETGQIVCWGENWSGQIGDGTSSTWFTDDRLTPTMVVEIDNAVAVVLGEQHSCALLSSTQVKCWGRGQVGQLGNGSIREINPRPISAVRLKTSTLADVPVAWAGNIASEDIGIFWGQPHDGYCAIEEFFVEMKESNTVDWELSGSVEAGVFSLNVVNLVKGNTYDFRVGVTNCMGTRYSQVFSARTLTTKPNEPVIYADSITSSSVELTWSPPYDGGSSISDYTVEFRLSGTSTWELFEDEISTLDFVVVTGLQPDTSYEFRVGAMNESGTTFSSVLIARTLQRIEVYSVSPTSVSRGSAIDVSGVSLSLVSEVRIGSLVVPFRFVSDSLIVVTVPTTATSGNLRLLSSSQDVVAGALTVLTRAVKPTITAVEPYVSVPGAVVTVRGNNVGAASTVRIGSVSVPFSVTGRGSFTITLGANFVNGKVQVTTPGGSVKSSGTLVVPPRITTSTLRAGAGVLVSLTGENLVDVTSVSVGGKTVTPSSKTANSVSFTIPTGVITGSGTVTGPGGVSNSFTFELLNPPTLDSFTISAKIGDTITLTGTNLMNVTGVKVGTTAASSFSSTDTTVTFVVPTGATSNKVTFSGAAGTVTSASTLTVAQPPRITSISPKRGKVGSTVTITGTNLSNATVTFGTKAATKSTNTATQIKVKVPTGLAKGVVTIKVVTANGEATISFTVT